MASVTCTLLLSDKQHHGFCIHGKTWTQVSINDFRKNLHHYESMLFAMEKLKEGENPNFNDYTLKLLIFTGKYFSNEEEGCQLREYIEFIKCEQNTWNGAKLYKKSQDTGQMREIVGTHITPHTLESEFKQIISSK